MSINKDLKNKLIPKEGNLFTYWYCEYYNNKKIKIYTVVCKCGCKELIVVEKGIRCMGCQEFHSHNSFAKAREECRKAKYFNDGKIKQVPQPFIEQWKQWKIRADLIRASKPKIITSFKI